MTAVAPTRPPALADRPARQSVPWPAALATLARRRALAAVRAGDVVFATLGPVIFFVCFYVPLHRQFERVGGEYAPIVLLQAGVFTAIVTTEAAGEDAREGVRQRLASLPIPRVTPFLARMAWVSVRMLLILVGGLAIAFALGFRFHGSVWATLAFLGLVVLFGLSLSMLTDAVGTVAGNATSVATVLMIPQLILVLASTGLLPAAAFPEWVQPFVRNQPLSVFAEALRGLAAGSAIAWTAVLCWSAGLLLIGAAAAVAAGRAQVRR